MQIENKHILIGGLLLIGGYLAYKEFGKKGEDKLSVNSINKDVFDCEKAKQEYPELYQDILDIDKRASKTKEYITTEEKAERQCRRLKSMIDDKNVVVHNAVKRPYMPTVNYGGDFVFK